VLLLSGGLDSTTLLAAARSRGWGVNALTLRYGQKHAGEVRAARRAARRHGCLRHVLLRLPLNAVALSALTTPAIEVPRGGMEAGIPSTYVPARNLVFLSVAVAWAESLEVRDVFIGVNRVDFSGYPDCRDRFIRAFERAAREGTKIGRERGGIRVHAPFLALSKSRIIGLGTSLGVDYSGTRTCYDPNPGGAPCGRCDACRLRRKGFEEAGMTDPAAAGARGRGRAR